MSVYTVGDGKTSAAIQTAIDLIPGNLSGHGKEWVQVYAKAAGYSGTFDSYGGFSNASSSDYIDIEAMVSHEGIRGQGIVLDMNDTSDFRGIIFALGYVRFHGFCVTRSLYKAATGNAIIGIHDPSSYVQVYDNLFYDSNADAGQIIRGIYVYDSSIVGLLITNCQVFNLGSVSGNPQGIKSDGAGTAGNENVFSNNSVLHDSDFGGRDYLVVNNNYFSSCSRISGAHDVIAYNISSDTTADDWGGTGNLINKASTDQFVSVSAGSEDLHLKATADCFRNGADMSQYFTHDCVNIPRKFWRTGAFETLPTVYSVNDGNPHKVYYSWGGNLAKVDGADVPLRNTETMTSNDAATIQVGQFESGLQFGGLIGDLKIFDDSDVKDTRP